MKLNPSKTFWATITGSKIRLRIILRIKVQLTTTDSTIFRSQLVSNVWPLKIISLRIFKEWENNHQT